jgi:hypothetical protein
MIFLKRDNSAAAEAAAAGLAVEVVVTMDGFDVGAAAVGR